MIKLIEKTVFKEKPSEKTGVIANTYYTGNGLNLMCEYSYIHLSDITDVAYRQFSDDHGKTWSEPLVRTTQEKLDHGILRDNIRSPVVYKKKNLLITFGVTGILPTGDPLEGLKWWHVYYMVSKDQGKTYHINERIILNGDEYDEKHPVTDVYEGKNSVMIGDTTELAIITEHQKSDEDNDCLLLPVQITPIGPDGEYYNPGGGYTYHYSAVIRGKIADDGHINWESISNKIENDPAISTRGAIEPTIIELDDGRILMVLRGSNGGTKDVDCRLPGYRWFSYSEDGGRTFKKPVPWMFNNHEPFYSPSSCSQLLKHSNGKIYWIGNISKENPKANMPRNPIYIAEVDQTSLLLKKDTLFVIDKVSEGQSANTTFSNFYAREDKVTQHIILHITPFHQQPDNIFGSHSYRYELEVK
ncbi:MAG: exo-alpha-sialidase [Clostridia bacterium]|nr:exo-alpha-sialidase [Clostridia bacterium]